MRTILVCLVLVGCSVPSARVTRADACSMTEPTFTARMEALGAGPGEARNAFVCPFRGETSASALDACLVSVDSSTSTSDARLALFTCADGGI